MNLFFSTNTMILEAKKAKFLPNGFLQVLIFILVFLVIQIFSSIPIVVYILFTVFPKLMRGEMEPSTILNETALMNSVPHFLEITLFSTVLTIAIVLIYVRFIEKRSFLSLGFTKKNIFSSYILGYIIGIAMFSLAVAILVLSGNLEFKGFTLSSPLNVLIFFIGFFIQGMSEEVLLRGYLFTSLAARHTVLVGIIVNSLFFGFLHLLNPNVSVLAIINIILFGVFASVYVLEYSNLWGIGALHSAWNFVQGNVFGIRVSGMNANESIFSFVPKGNALFNGGGFGLEGGLVVTFVLALATMVLMRISSKKRRKKLALDDEKF